MLRRSLLLALPLCALVPTTQAAEDEAGAVKGAWRFNIEYELVGLPQKFPAYQFEQCLDSGPPIPNINRPGNECKVELQGIFDTLHTWTLDCSDDWEMVQGMGRINYTGSGARGEVYLQILNPHNPPQIMSYTINGTHLGRCGE